MYNRYTPKQDGSFNKNRVQEQPVPCPPPVQEHQPPQPHCEPPRQKSPCNTATGFLSGLFPKNMDTGDLLMLLILLLLFSDGSENAPDPLLTIALFFLME